MWVQYICSSRYKYFRKLISGAGNYFPEPIVVGGGGGQCSTSVYLPFQMCLPAGVLGNPWGNKDGQHEGQRPVHTQAGFTQSLCKMLPP